MSHRNQVVTASAGTGKTHQLSTRYLQLLVENESVPKVERILATTFTRKAAGEIFDRIVGRLVKSLTEPNGAQELASSLQVDQLDRARCQSCLQALTRQLHRARILTLDAFFAELALNFSMELSLPAAWQIADDALARRVRDRAIGRMLIELGGQTATELVHQLAKGELKRDVDSLLDQAIKDLFDVFRAAHDMGEDAWNWMKPATPSASQTPADLAARVDELLNAGGQPGRQLATALEKLKKLVDNQRWLDVSQTTLIQKSRLSGAYGKTRLSQSVREALNLIAACAADGLRSQLMWQNQAIFRLLTAYAGRYREVCEEQRLAFFSDITHALRDFQHRHDVLGYRLDGQIDHLLLDEFQDTSPDQWRVLQPLAERILRQGRGTFFCVGDVKQAIYAWRHGSSEILQDLAHALPSQGMNETRRSYPAVVAFINQVFLNLKRHALYDRVDADADIVDQARAEAIGSWVDQFPRHVSVQAAKRDPDSAPVRGYACLRIAPRPSDTEAQPTATQTYVAQLVAQMLTESPEHDIGVLVRTNVTVTQIIHHLRQLGINASEIGGNPLTNSAPARLILSLLRVADHPGHSAACYHVASSPLGIQLGFTTPPKPGAQRSVQEYARQLRHDLLRKGYGPTVTELVNRLAGYCTRLQRRRLRQLVDLAYVFQPQATPRPSDFVEFVEATRVPDPTTANVHVLTIHQAKGLEYDRVVVTELDKMFRPPSYCYQRDPQTYAPCRIVAYVNRSAQRLLGTDLTELYREDQRREFREELCNLYVALTRARYELQLVVQPTPAEARQFPATLAGLVCAALCDSVSLKPETVAVSRGDEFWYRDVAVVADRDHTAPHAPQPRPDKISFKASAADVPHMPSTSPSELEGTSRVPVASLFSATRQASLQHGTLIHAWFESIDWLDGKLPSVERLQRLAAQLGITASKKTLESFLHTLQQPGIQQVLCYEPYRAEAAGWLNSIAAGSPLRFEVRNEQPILFSETQRLLSGVVDRLVLIFAGDQLIAADTIDFKTDDVDSEAAIRERSEFYAPQLTAYRQAVAGMLRIDPQHVRARLVFTEADAVVPISWSPFAPARVTPTAERPSAPHLPSSQRKSEHRIP